MSHTSSKDEYHTRYFQKIPLKKVALALAISATIIGSYAFYKKYLTHSDDKSDGNNMNNAATKLHYRSNYQTNRYGSPDYEEYEEYEDYEDEMKGRLRLQASLVRNNSLVQLQMVNNDEKQSVENIVNTNNKEWSPSKVKIQASYVGNGLVQIQMIEGPEAIIERFELQYRIINVKQKRFSETDDEFFDSVEFTPYKMDWHFCAFHLRIPQNMTDYILELKLRGRFCKDELSMNTMKWSPYSMLHSITIPFDASIQFEKGQIVHVYIEGETGIIGKIIKIINDKIALIERMDIESTNNYIVPFITKKVPLHSLRYFPVLQRHTVDILDWNDIFENVLLPISTTTDGIDYKAIFQDLREIFAAYLYRNDMIDDVFWENDMIKEMFDVYSREFGYFQISEFAKYLSFEVMKMLYGDSDCNKSLQSIHCGLCSEKDHHRSLMKCRNTWNAEIYLLDEWMKKQTNYENKVVKDQMSTLINLEVSSVCDICQIQFHHFDYYYLCESKSYHMICLPCINKYVLKHKQLRNVLNEMYDIHGLSDDCIVQIVYFIVGWIYSI